MGFTDKIESAYKAFNGPDQEELFNESQKLDDKINNESPLQKSITKLIKKIEKSNTSEERYILEEQLLELEKINDLYQNNIKNNLTKTTKKEIQSLLIGLEPQINSKENILEDDYENLENIFNKENEKLEDTIDIISANTIRDVVENSIDIQGVRESIYEESYQNFFDIVTVTYIDFLKNKKKDEILIKNKGLYLEKTEIVDFIEKLIQRLGKIDLDFNFIMKLKKGDFEGNFIINLDEYKNKLEKINETKRQEEEKIKQDKRFEENIENADTEKRMEYITEKLNLSYFKPSIKSLLIELIRDKNTLGTRTIYLKDSPDIQINKEFLEKNKVNIIKNLKTLILFIIEIESDGNPKVENQWSSAKGLGQWLNDDGKFSDKYYYEGTEYLKKIKGRKPDIIKNTRNTSSLETRLNNIKRTYIKKKLHPEIILNDLEFIPSDFRKKAEINITNIELKKQIKILILDLGSNKKEYKGKTIKEYLRTLIIGNHWALESIYRIFHHTNPDAKTEKRIKRLSPKYSKMLIPIK